MYIVRVYEQHIKVMGALDNICPNIAYSVSCKIKLNFVVYHCHKGKEKNPMKKGMTTPPTPTK